MDDEGLRLLRERAEAALSGEGGGQAALGAEEAKALIHDLRVHQIELEMQNDELRASRNELELTRDGYARLYNMSPLGYISLDEHGIIRKANRTFLELVGAEERDAKDRAFIEFLADGDREVFLGRFNSFFRRPEGKTMDLRLSARGRSIVARLNGRRESLGKTLLASVTDITAQVKAEAELREVEHLWKETFEAMRDAVWILDLEGRVLRYNSASLELFGRQPDALHGCYCHQVMHDSDVRPEDCPFLRMRETRQRETHVFKRGAKWLEVSADPLSDGSGTLIGTVHILKDITERKNAEDHIRALLEEKQLLLKEVHHRIKNNMNVATAFLSLQEERSADEKARTALEDARRRLMSMQVIYDKLYRSESFSGISVSDYVNQLLDSIFDQFPRRRIRVERSIDDFTLDSTKLFPLGIILNELITNSFKYAFPQGDGGRVFMRLSCGADGIASFSVGDEGAGLPPDFDPERSGGFGMTLVRALVDQIGGTLAVHPRGPTEFSIRFPVKP